MKEKSSLQSTVRLLIVFTISFSLASLPGPLSPTLRFGDVPVANASLLSAVPNSPWYPAGAATNTEVVNIFASSSSELSALCSGLIDLTDFPFPQTLPQNLCPNIGNIAISTPVSDHTFFDIEFNLGNNFWGVPFQFGNNASGVQIRQGIAHLFDKTVYTSNDPDLAGRSITVDDQVLPGEGLPAANPCAWDPLFPETGTSCIVGAPGGLSYHIASASGLCGTETSKLACQYPWMQGFGSRDFCAAAQHFVAAGLGTGEDANCVLTGINTAALTSHSVNLVAKSDRLARYRLGAGIAQGICALLTGSFTTGCIGGSPGTSCTVAVGTAMPANAILCLSSATGYPSCVFYTGTPGVDTCWGMYTGGFGGVFPFDGLLYTAYNSQFVSGGSFDHPPCTSTLLQDAAFNYLYMCVPAYDTVSNATQLTPCLSAPGDPVAGQSTPTFANCPGTSKLTDVSAGYQAEDLFGRGAYAIPVYGGSTQNGYLANWSRVINADGVGIANYFTWLDAHSVNPAVAGTIRQGFSQPTFSLNPYAATIPQDFYVLSNIYDSLYLPNPSNPAQVIDWMVANDQVLNNSQLGYTPPAGTIASIRNTLRTDLFWHDGAKVTSWDVKFDFLTLLANCRINCVLTGPVVSVHVLSASEFDINLRSIGPFTKQAWLTPTIFPGRHWTVCGQAAWDTDVATGNVPDSCMAVPLSMASITFDPLAAGILIGSGSWMCKNLLTGIVGGGCSSTGLQNPPAGGSYTLTRFGVGSPPAGSPVNSYFRSGGDLALYIWSGNTGDSTHDIINISIVALCLGKPLGTINCTHWQKGIGAPGASAVVDITQVSEVARFFGLSWTSPFAWNDLTGAGSFPPVLYEGTLTLNPCSIDPVNGYDC